MQPVLPLGRAAMGQPESGTDGYLFRASCRSFLGPRCPETQLVNGVLVNGLMESFCRAHQEARCWWSLCRLLRTFPLMLCKAHLLVLNPCAFGCIKLNDD